MWRNNVLWLKQVSLASQSQHQYRSSPGERLDALDGHFVKVWKLETQTFDWPTVKRNFVTLKCMFQIWRLLVESITSDFMLLVSWNNLRARTSLSAMVRTMMTTCAELQLCNASWGTQMVRLVRLVHGVQTLTDIDEHIWSILTHHRHQPDSPARTFAASAARKDCAQHVLSSKRIPNLTWGDLWISRMILRLIEAWSSFVGDTGILPMIPGSLAHVPTTNSFWRYSSKTHRKMREIRKHRGKLSFLQAFF